VQISLVIIESLLLLLSRISIFIERDYKVEKKDPSEEFNFFLSQFNRMKQLFIQKSTQSQSKIFLNFFNFYNKTNNQKLKISIIQIQFDLILIISFFISKIYNK